MNKNIFTVLMKKKNAENYENVSVFEIIDKDIYQLFH
jgi:hypothetical protein